LIGKVFLADIISKVVGEKVYNNIKEYKAADKSWPEEDDDLPF